MLVEDYFGVAVAATHVRLWIVLVWLTIWDIVADLPACPAWQPVTLPGQRMSFIIQQTYRPLIFPAAMRTVVICQCAMVLFYPVRLIR